jgi:hypothetical protein
MMRKISRLWIPLFALTVAAACTAEVEDEGELPDVDVSGGEAPNIDVDPANLTVSTDTQTIVTPDVDVTPR